MSVDPLQCATCAAPVPLVDGDHGTCPNCGAQYPIPETYRALRDEAGANARKPEAIALAKQIGKPPPRLIRALAVFSSGWFIFAGLGFWIAFGVMLSFAAMPWFGRHLFHVLTYDVLSEQRQMQLSIVLPFGMLVIGFTVASWARRTGIVRGGLQAALAAAPPAKPGGPKTCRQCAAPLAPKAGALAARCAYCNADNLVELPPAWIDKMRSQAKQLKRELRAAAKEWQTERRALRRSLIKRFVLWTLVLVVPLWFIMGAAAGSDLSSASSAYLHASRPPGVLPRWSDELNARFIGTCQEDTDDVPATAVCGDGRCALYEIVPLRHGEVVTYRSSDLPAGSMVNLEMHDQSLAFDRWSTVVSEPLSAGHPATTKAPYSGWYRIRITVPDPARTKYRYCTKVSGP
jgi:hypothetical protein